MPRPLLLLVAVIVSAFCAQVVGGQPRDQASSKKAQGGEANFPCRATAENLPGTFTGFLNSHPSVVPVKVTISFAPPKDGMPFSCVGNPLEITVPNEQIVEIFADHWPDSCKPTASITPATSDNIILDLLNTVAKIGPLFVEQPPRRPIMTLPTLKHRALTLAVECSIDSGLKQSQTVKINYQGPPHFVLSGGLIITPGVKSYGINTTNTGVTSTGVAITQNTIAVTGNPRAQVVPFSFFNIYLSGKRELNVSTQLGLGVNPNLSSARVEYFAAPLALSWKDIYFAPGFHFGQEEELTGGFKVGDVVTGLNKAPTKFVHKTHFGFSLSYNLKPLVKSGSK